MEAFDFFQRRISRRFSTALLALLGSVMGGAGAHGAIVSIATPALDKWHYGNVGAIPSGDSQAAPVFANFGDGIDRLAGMLVGFDTAAAQIPKGLGAASYQITSVRLTLTVLSNNSFNYDPTYDSYRVHLSTTDANYLADSDTGHPVEVFGLGLRNGFTELSGTITGSTTGPKYHEYSPYGDAALPNAFPLGQTTLNQPLTDANDNVSQNKEAIPFGLGVTTSLTPGAAVPAETELTFQLQVTNDSVLTYLREALNTGILGLYVSSLYPAVGQGGPVTYPRFYTREGAADALAPEFAPRLDIQYTVVPEPNSSVLTIAAVSLLAAIRGLRHRNRLT